MIQLVVLSGKGGTGKTTITAALAERAHSAELELVLADADVDAANLALLVSPNASEAESFLGGEIARIDAGRCEACGACEDVCRFDAVIRMNDGYAVDPLACEGCGACLYVCPSEALSMETQKAGEWFFSHTDYGSLFHAELEPGEENSGKLVALLKQRARLEALDQNIPGVLVDGPPGIGCPVISAVSGADAALIVSEPTAAGVHDLKRIVATARHFQIPVWVCINKADLYVQGAEQIRAYCQQEQLEILAEIPFDDAIMQAMENVQPVTRFAPDSPASHEITNLWDKLRIRLVEEGQYV
ncbi:MAG: ATP-binding protein [Anaerolineales bacterium]|jgi:MinD superfamily P-loop ATPase